MKARLHRLDSHYVLCQVLAIFVRYVQVAIVEGFVEKRPLRLYRWIRMSTLFHAGFQSAALAIPCGERRQVCFIVQLALFVVLLVSFWHISSYTHVIVVISFLVFVLLSDRFGLQQQLHRLHRVHRLHAPWSRRLVSFVTFGSVGTLAVVSDRLYIRVAACATCSSSSSSTSWTRRPARSQKETSLETQDCGLVVT